ncbi:DUF6266 family protein [Myroides odoratus]|uniref:Uncharacterized protein n=1 Tax=Myroides odoratus TaxID=256 RepID=A0A9Q7EBG3_MYROD|nr:DUF6266 family protein [Myroides odoratus]EHQ44010.1 hypothetical protein Myrod_3197 [Myroides odoratus DSM 2801]EKB05089.1 hypothetical protein HMPREF9716_02896 [Myroides odoratus CIP 103059]QQU01309.1 hypothetical protein I6I88_06045 [Myroides odoratus]WQD56428.1 DUF6266 family protein [Myroides odoratus]STZ31292.1 Uncharacterised protein [Myroides odoratus]
MAEIKQGILGGVSGKVGTVVGANWKGKNIIRSKPRKSSKKPTVLQLNQRAKFKLVSNFLQPINSILSRYFGSEQGLKTRVNLALSYHLQEAVENQDGNWIINPEKVVLSKGILPLINMENTTVDNSELNLTWNVPEGASLGSATDLLTVVVYNDESKVFHIFDKVTTRDSGTFTGQLPVGFQNASNVIWVFLTNELDTECSTSMFLGSY